MQFISPIGQHYWCIMYGRAWLVELYYKVYLGWKLRRGPSFFYALSHEGWYGASVSLYLERVASTITFCFKTMFFCFYKFNCYIGIRKNISCMAVGEWYNRISNSLHLIHPKSNFSNINNENESCPQLTFEGIGSVQIICKERVKALGKTYSLYY